MGCSVVALCFDEHHRTHFRQFLTEHAVEEMVAGTTLVFKDDALQARSVQLNLTTTKPKAASAPEDKGPEDEKPKKGGKGKNPKSEKGKKEEGKQDRRKKAKKTSSSGASARTVLR